MLRERLQAGYLLQNPRWVTALFSNTEYAWLWLMARLYIGWGWLDAGWHKVTGQGWMDGGTSLQGYWTRAAAVPEQGRPAIVYDWYREFLQFLLNTDSYVWFAKLVAVGETLVGIALLVGIFTGIAALFGAFMNWNFMLAGSASTNPVMGILGLGILVAWKTAGWWGLDRVVLPLVGTPWQKGPIMGGKPAFPEGQQRNRFMLMARRWIQMAISAGVALIALITLDGAWQVIVLLLAGVLAVVTGLGLFPRVSQETEP